MLRRGSGARSFMASAMEMRADLMLVLSRVSGPAAYRHYRRRHDRRNDSRKALPFGQSSTALSSAAMALPVQHGRLQVVGARGTVDRGHQQDRPQRADHA